ncbi:hypothetical protein [Paracoccus saliphilus]|uniref:Uncharacterized protein n=1 Tax=Paracoccus saliphilus TaxID=405559 RepID=A0AA45W7P0_9RHOB|nr:hypothetical protein [Paracoccus saliphilus]SIT11294.1 hypothetical protein SAMN05421772_11957 [Paracoccus saliphilus]
MRRSDVAVLCNNCGGPKPDDHYRACPDCRAEWRARARKPGGTAERIDALENAVRLALPCLRDDLHTIIESASLPDGLDGEDRMIPREGSMHAHEKRFANPIIKAIRAGEALIGRQRDNKPVWLDRIIDGTRRM